MGRASILLGFALIGFTLGFAGYLAFPWIGQWSMEILPRIVRNETLIGAFLSGIAGSILTTVSVYFWARTTKAS